MEACAQTFYRSTQQERFAAIHWKQGLQPTPRVTITVPEKTETSPAGPPAESPQLPKVADTVAAMEPPVRAESTPMRAWRVRAIWGLISISLLPGLVVAVAPAFWRALPSWAHWTAYAFSGVLIVAVVGLIVTDDGARE